MSTSETSETGLESGGTNRRWRALAALLISAVFIASAIYFYLNPLFADSGWVRGIGFYELFPSFLGLVALYAAYRYSGISVASRA